MEIFKKFLSFFRRACKTEIIENQVITAKNFADNFYNSSYYNSTQSSLRDVIKDQGRLGDRKSVV